MKRLVMVTGALLAGCGLAWGEAAMTAAELDGLKRRFDGLKKIEEKLAEDFKEDLEKAEDALKVEMVRREARPWQLGYLRCIMMIEEDLRLLAEPEDKVSGDPESREWSTQEKKKVESLRQEIREAERARIREELKEGREPRSDEKTEERILKDQQALDALFDRNTSKLKRDIARAERDLSKEKFSPRGDERKAKELEENLEEWDAELRTVHRYVYGFESGAGFERPAPEGDSPAAKLLGALVAERDRVLKVLRGEEVVDEGEKKGGLVGGSFLYSSNLGVMLDISGSMRNHIEPLKEEIAETFEVPRYREVVGCRIDGSQLWVFERGQGRGLRADTASMIEELVVVYKVDTVYWFCDLRDPVTAAGVRRLRTLFKRGGSDFHVKSMAMGPTRELKPLITDFQD